jgi:general secretion pathway protein K
MTRTRTKKTRTKTKTTDRRQRGVALLVVVWTFAVLAVIAAEFARAMHDEAMSTRNFKESALARNTAIAGINEAILALRARRQNEGQLEEMETEDDLDPIRSLSQGDGSWVEATWRGKPYEVRVIDEAGKLSLNRLDSAALLEIFLNLEIPEDEAKVIADSIVDWRDSDDLHQPEGAETEYYEDLPRPYRAKNAGFDSVDELLLVRGVTLEIYHGNEDYPGLR